MGIAIENTVVGRFNQWTERNTPPAPLIEGSLAVQNLRQILFLYASSL